ncbi:MAG: HAMP domain-containing sensor histidine kinase [Bacteroidia bacterium]
MALLKKIKGHTLLHIAMLFISLSVASYFLTKGWYGLLALMSIIVVYQLIALYKLQRRVQNELSEFVKALQYRDFSRHFNVEKAPTELRFLRQSFNEINELFKAISKERETQYQYLQKVLELVDTGILSYETESGEVVWMNESLKKMLEVPYLKTIHSLSIRDENLYKEIITLKPGASKIAVVQPEKNAYKILLSSTAFQTDGKKFNFIAFQNINEALNEAENKAWQKLLGVLTHEIMNSIAPISSLADTIKNRLPFIVKTDNTGAVDDLELAIETIKRRSEGLLKFAETYRNLNKIAKPVLKKFYVRDLFENLYSLMQPTLKLKNMELEIILKDPYLILEADIHLIEQVLINLLVNAMDAIKEKDKPRIALSASTTNDGKMIIKMVDNGTGITEEVRDKIFVPFFSTKKNGSGIGLTLCKQIMILHRGDIMVQSKVNEGSDFMLHF